MIKLFWTFIAGLTFLGCYGQRYEAWVRTSDSHNVLKGNYGFSNDSILMIYSNPSLFIPSRDTYFNWDDLSALEVRNKSRNQMGQLTGTSFGVLASYLLVEAAKNSSSEKAAFFPLFLIIEIPVITLTGTLIGHLATKRKTDIPLNGLNSKDRNQLLKSTIQKKK